MVLKLREPTLRRREFIGLLGAVAVWPVGARAQPKAVPVIGFISGRSAEASARYIAAFRNGLREAGYIEGQNLAVEYTWLDGHYERLPTILAELVRRPVTVIATPASTPAAIAAKAATSTIPIIFSVAQDPVKLGLVESVSRPGGNATGVNFFAQEVAAKRLRLLHDLVPKAVRVAVLINPANASSAKYNLQSVQDAAPTMGLEIQPVLKASTIDEIDEAFVALSRDAADVLFVAGDGFFDDRAMQIAGLASRAKIPAAYQQREGVVAGGLMSYGTDFADSYRQVATYVGKILRGAKPADLPVQQASKFEFVINRTAAQTLGLAIPPALVSIADEVVE